MMVSKEDYSPLLGALEKLLERTGGKAIVYEPPEVKLMATTLIKKVCPEFESIDALADQLMTMRNVLQGFQVEMKLARVLATMERWGVGAVPPSSPDIKEW